MAFIAVDAKVCTGCRMCEVVCSLYHRAESNPERAAIRVIRKERAGLVTCLPLVCQQCAEPACVNACPTEALSQGIGESALALEEDRCSGCGDCVDACPAGAIFMDERQSTPIFCDLCGGEPQCVELCHSSCLTHEGLKRVGGPGVESLTMALEELGLWEGLPGKGGR